ncbi:MAG: PilN domain-containing protein [Armatimonadota bacterium]
MQPEAGRCLGLYLSHGSAKATLLESDGEQVWISALREASLPLSAVDESGAVRSPEAVVEGITNAIAGLQGAPVRVCLAVGGTDVILRTMTLPPMRDGEILEAIRAEIAHYSLFSLGEEVVGYQTYSAPEPDAPRRLLVAATHRRVVESCQAVGRAFGKPHEGLEGAILAAARAALVAGDLKSPEPALTMLLLLGGWGTEALILSEEEVLFAHSVDLKVSGTLTEQAASAQETLLDHFDEAVESGELSRRAEAIRSLCVEASHCLRFFEREFPDAPPVGRVGVFADVPVSDDVERALGEHLRIPVLELDPCRNIELTDPSSDGTDLRANRVVYAPAVGAALRGMGISPQSFAAPLAARKRPSPERLRQKGVLLALLPGALLLVVCLILSGHLRARVRHNQAQVRAMHADIASLEQAAIQSGLPLKQKKEVLDALDAAKGRIAPAKTSRAQVLQEVVSRLPRDARLSRAAIDERGRVSLEGFAAEGATASEIVVSLSNSELFQSLRLTSLKRIPGGASSGVQFQITGELKQG